MASTATTPQDHDPCPRAATPGECVAVIVNYRCADQTRACVESLPDDLRIVVVDNASGDDSLERLAGLEVIASDENLGFGGGCNLGFERALEDDTVRYVLLINPDAIAEPDLLDELLRGAARHPEAAIIGGRILSLDGESVLFENGRFPGPTISKLHVPAPKAPFEFTSPFVTGALMLIDAAELRRGLRFDENYFLYVEDLDLCHQVLRRDRAIVVNTRAVIRHADGGTQSQDKPVLGHMRALQLRCLTRGKVYFARKFVRGWKLAVVLLALGLVKPFAAVLRYRRIGFLPLYFRAFWQGLRMPVEKVR